MDRTSSLIRTGRIARPHKGRTQPRDDVAKGAPEAVRAPESRFTVKTPTVLPYWLAVKSRAPVGERLRCRGQEPPLGTVSTRRSAAPPSVTAKRATLSWPRLER